MKKVIFKKIRGRIVPILREGNLYKAMPSMSAKHNRVRTLRGLAKYSPDATRIVSEKMMKASKKEGKELAFIFRQTLKSLKKKV
jgi:hypothetical protein